MALRAIPNLWYVRPADANETAMAWRIALEREGGPVALALSRQKLPTLDRSEVAAAEGALRGAYALWQSGDGRARLILLATGSEVCASRSRPRGRWTGRTSASSRCRAGSSSTEQPADYREEVLPPEVARPALGRGRASRSAGSAGSATAATRSRSTTSAPRRPGTRCSSASASRPRTWSKRATAVARARRRMKVAVAFDHRGVKLRERRARGCSRRSAHDVVDLGTDTDAERIDYPDKAREVGAAIRPARRSAGCSSAARASARASPPARSPGSARRSATTPTPPTRASSTTT